MQINIYRWNLLFTPMGHSVKLVWADKSKQCLAKGQLYVSIEFFWNTLLKDALSKVLILKTIGGDVTSHKSSCFLITNSGVFVNFAVILINICVKRCKILLGASLILFDVLNIWTQGLSTLLIIRWSFLFGPFSLSVCLSYWCCSSAKPLPVSCFFSVSLSLFLCVYSSLFCLFLSSAVCLWPSLMSTPWWSTGASLGKVSPPYCRTATVQLTRWLLSLSFFFPSWPSLLLPSSLLIHSGSLHSTACFILPWLTLVITGPSLDLNVWTQSYRSTFEQCLWYCTPFSEHSQERVIDYQ